MANLYFFLRYRIQGDPQLERAIELGLPIPGTGKIRRYRYYRSPRANGARYELSRYDDREILREYGRAPKRVKVPPTAWDDMPSKALWNHNWKRFRRTRWKPKD